MSWARSTFTALAFFFAGALTVIPVAAAAGIVVASSGPSSGDFPVGTKLEDNARVTLKAGDVVTVLDKNGTRVLRGAGAFTIGQASRSGKVSTFAALTRQRSASRVRTGAVRNGPGDGELSSPNLWYVDVTKSGRMCLIDPVDVRLWRPDMEQAASYRIAASSPDASISLSFEANAMIAPWDTDALPVIEGRDYTIAKAGGEPVRVDFALLEANGDDAEGLAAQLIEKGCTNQLALLADNLKTSDQ